MSKFKLRLLIAFFVLVSIFPAYKLIKAQAEDQETTSSEQLDSGTEQEASEQTSAEEQAPSEQSSGQQESSSQQEATVSEKTVDIDTGANDTSIPEPETTQEEAKEESSSQADVDKVLQEVKAEAPKNSTTANIATIAHDIIKKTYKDKDELKLSSIARKILPISSQKSDLEKKLDAFALKKPVVKKITKGFRIKAVVIINKHPLNACIEVGKKDNVWYSIFYIKSPAKWKVSEYFPELLDINKILPGIDKSILGKYTKSDLFEFGDSYFYISTVGMEDYKKFGKIVKGTGFSGKVKFAGAFETFDKILGLDGKYLEIYGTIPVKLVDSEFTIKTPKSTIIPEVLKIPGKPDVKLIKGFTVDLAPHEFYIKFIKKDLPEFKAKGGIIVKVPYEDLPIEFSSSLDFADKKLKLSGEQITKMSKLFGLDGFSADACKVDIAWDFGSKNVLPKSLNIAGELKSGKSKLKLEKFEVSTTEEKKINLVVLAKGSLYTKDFAQFWLDAIIKDSKINKQDVIKLVPEIVLEDVTLDINWKDAVEERKIELRANKMDVKLGTVIKGLLPAAAAGLESELNIFSLKKSVAKYYKEGFRINSTISVREKPVKTVLEIAKEDGKWYSLFYIKSPDVKPSAQEAKDEATEGTKQADAKLPATWKLSDYFPDFLSPSKLFPNMGKTLSPDLFEFSDTFFCVSTMDMTVSEKIGKVVKGVSFKGKAKFTGELEFIDKIFGLEGKFFEVSGNITSKFADSDFSIKIPKATIIPEVLKISGKPDIKLIPGFKVDVKDQNFKIKLTKGLPEFMGSGIITVKLPYEDKLIDFKSKIDFADKKLKISGKQKTKMDSLFGLKDFSAQDCKVNISWDFGTKNVLPKSLRIRGKLQSGKSKLDLTNFEVSSTEEKKLNLVVLAKGSLYTKDFAQFWLDAIIKDKKITDVAMPLVPEIVLDDVSLNVNWTDDVEKRAFKLKINKADIKLGEAVKGLIPNVGGQKSDVQDYLNKFAIKKAVVDYYKGGLRLRSNVSINNKPIKTCLEIAKNDDKKWYSLFYLESPEVWKLSELFPDFLDASKLFPKMNKDALAKLPKDVFEFKKSFFYISTIDIPEYKKSIMSKNVADGKVATKAETEVDVKTEEADTSTEEADVKAEEDDRVVEADIAKEEAESEKTLSTEDGATVEETTEAAEKVAKDKITINIVKGVGFSGKAKFIGAFDFVDKIMGLEGKYFTVSGNIQIPKFIGSDFSIKIPTTKTIIPETIKIGGQDVKLIPGFKVDLMPQEFKIKFVKGIPEFSGSGGIKVTVPYEKTPLEFSSSIAFEDKNLKISGDQKTQISKLFGVDGLVVDGCHADISWDASKVNPVPKAVNITGKINSGKSSLDLKLDFSLDDKNKVALGLTTTGSLFLKDFAEFWLNVIIKDPKITSAVKPLIPDIKLEDVILDANWADKEEDRKLSLKVKKADIKLGEIAKVLIPQVGGQKSDIETYLNKFAITKASAEYYKQGIKIKGSTLINNNPLDVLVEACKDDKKGWYALFYLKSPEKWKVSDYIPDFLNAKTLFPKLDPKILAQLEKPDIFEFSESYFYISTASLKEHGKMGDLVQGAGFKGKAKFIGILDVLDKVFVLNGQPLEISGAFKVPKIFGSNFSITIPTNAPIVPESIVVNGKKQDLIKGFKVDLTPHTFAIKLIEDVPYVQLDATGGIKVKIPFIKEDLDFFSKIKFSGKQMSLSGGQKNKLSNVLGVQGLGLDGCEIGLNWDFGVSGQWAGQLAPVTFGVGALAVALPTGFIIEGGLSSQKSGSNKICSLNIKTDFSLNSTNAIDLKYESKGTLFAKDFASFWLDVVVNTPNKQSDKKFKEDFMRQVPDFTFEDVYIKGAWAKDADKELELSVKKVELIKDVSASMSLKVSEKGISGSGAILVPVYLPDKKNPIFTIKKSMDNDSAGPSFSIDCTLDPVKIALKSDAAVIAKLGGALGDIKSATHIDVSEDGVAFDTKSNALGIDSNVKFNGKLGTPIKIDDWAISGGFEQKATEELSKLLKKTSDDLLKANKDLTKKQDDLMSKNTAAQKKAVSDIDAAQKRVTNDIDKFFKDTKNIASYAETALWNEVLSWEKICNTKPWYEKPWCDLFQVTSRKILVEAVKLYKNIAADILSNFAKKAVEAVSNAGKFFVSLSPDIKKNFDLLATSIAKDFTALAVEASKAIDEFGKNILTIHSFSFDAKVADIKNGKFPEIIYDATVMGRRPKEPVKLQLDIKNPTEFITKIATEITKNVLSGVSGKITQKETELSSKIDSESKKAADLIAAKEKEAKAEAGVK